MDTDRIEAVQNVVDRVSSYQDGAPSGTVETELRDGLSEAGVDLTDEQLDQVTAAIASGEPVDVSQLLA